MIRLIWKFDNDHQWHRDFATHKEAFDAAYDFGLYTHPRIMHVIVKDLENETCTGSLNLIDRRDLDDD
jgi:hypothetical protein